MNAAIHRKYFAAIVSLLVLLSGSNCLDKSPLDSLANEPRPHFVIVKKETFDGTAESYAGVVVTIKNNGSMPGSNVSCSVEVKKDGKTIDSGQVSFANGEEIQPSQQVTGTIYLKNIFTHEDYDSIKYRLYWP